MIQAIDAKCFASCGILLFGIGVWEFQLNKGGWGRESFGLTQLNE